MTEIQARKKIFLHIYQIIYLPFQIDEITCIVDQIVRINVTYMAVRIKMMAAGSTKSISLFKMVTLLFTTISVLKLNITVNRKISRF